ncbi:MAG: DUF3179 domain-containing protein [Candidatus Magasanikbacteria bacterium]|uniref:DUF3179 domain-containing protein n=1 Tax=Candidatus Magasanikbacteria bacterium CG10_big_fil_rev_8_21_14_0_10_38_6 TaxID=1974647 RepID=A0A2M6P2Z2_9BACT|nr:DUF3179 domain-containing protein [Candidatus Magasanikbacteria bacterium]PIR77780.1 MAG: hypothetical protein COU30_00605 [Candidatus Magasanikbacteria bacterium CG10_big_fil_rev_8_21_14_0_10_38_6]
MRQGNHVTFLILILVVGIGAAGVVLFVLTTSKPIIIEKKEIVEKIIEKEIPVTPTSSEKNTTNISFAMGIARDISSTNTASTTNAGEEDASYQITNGITHTVPLEKILAGGPEKDGIPSLDNPTFTSIKKATDIQDDGMGIAISVGDTYRFYPFQILVWHEIVNDVIEDQHILVTYCPLGGTGIVFDPKVNGTYTTFGTSGKLYQSNLVMYDTQTNSYWSQILGEAIVGKQTGKILTVLPYQIMRYHDWKQTYPNGEVLSTDTGFTRDYTTSPYGNYANDTSLFFPVDYTDNRYHPKMPTYVVTINDEMKAYPLEELEQSPEEFSDTIAGKKVSITYNKETKIPLFIQDNTQEKLIPIYGFWFSFVSVYPDIAVYTAN